MGKLKINEKNQCLLAAAVQLMPPLAKHKLDMVPESSSQEKMGFSTQDFTTAAFHPYDFE